MKAEIQKQILRTLRDARGHPLTQDLLILQTIDRTRPFPSETEVKEAITSLEALQFILRQDNELEPDNTIWLLDEKGQAFILRKRL